jgi:peptidoglycan/LPS O-acetylase OafA/YrhL
LGYIFFKNKKITLNYVSLNFNFYKINEKLKLKNENSKFVVAFGWFMSTCLALLAVFGGFTNHAKDARRMETVEYAFFFALSRFTWSLSMAWIIFACHYGYGGVINSFLSVKSFVPLTRLSYCAYLIHPPIMVFFYYTQEVLFHATMLTLVILNFVF